MGSYPSLVGSKKRIRVQDRLRSTGTLGCAPVRTRDGRADDGQGALAAAQTRYSVSGLDWFAPAGRTGAVE
ncbi:hypothetical protein AcV7_009677, partial [Taiwanofungus camphoratus]